MKVGKEMKETKSIKPQSEKNEHLKDFLAETLKEKEYFEVRIINKILRLHKKLFELLRI